ncbi:hypothetical protein ACWDBD_05070 [Streptomyces sp. NPDC001118]|uniref:hypothetical protein n=1 Tax=unclassified Streptomyces TaxID=2593676 RepID=UPI003329BAF1
MRARTVVAGIALAGTVLLGGAAQALADDNDDMGSPVGNSQGSGVMGNNHGGLMGNSGGDFGKGSHGKTDLGPDASGFGKTGSIFDRSDAK